MMQRADMAVIGAGIAGLAHAYAAARRGHHVVLFERHQRAVGASIRNFGLVWPVGAPEALVDRALRGRDIWLDLAGKANFGCQPNGSLLLAYQPDELRCWLSLARLSMPGTWAVNYLPRLK